MWRNSLVVDVAVHTHPLAIPLAVYHEKSDSQVSMSMGFFSYNPKKSAERR